MNSVGQELRAGLAKDSGWGSLMRVQSGHSAGSHLKACMKLKWPLEGWLAHAAGRHTLPVGRVRTSLPHGFHHRAACVSWQSSWHSSQRVTHQATMVFMTQTQNPHPIISAIFYCFHGRALFSLLENCTSAWTLACTWAWTLVDESLGVILEAG